MTPQKSIRLYNNLKLSIFIKILTITLENLTQLKRLHLTTDLQPKLISKKISKVTSVQTLSKNNSFFKKKLNKAHHSSNFQSQNLIH